MQFDAIENRQPGLARAGQLDFVQVAHSDGLQLKAAEQADQTGPVDRTRRGGQAGKVEDGGIAIEKVGHATQQLVQGIGQLWWIAQAKLGDSRADAGTAEFDRPAGGGCVHGCRGSALGQAATARRLHM